MQENIEGKSKAWLKKHLGHWMVSWGKTGLMGADMEVTNQLAVLVSEGLDSKRHAESEYRNLYEYVVLGGTRYSATSLVVDAFDSIVTVDEIDV